jgi:hypothetical protein
VRSNNSRLERFRAQFDQFRPVVVVVVSAPSLFAFLASSLHASLSGDVDAHVLAHLYELAIFNPLKRGDAVLRWTPERA